MYKIIETTDNWVTFRVVYETSDKDELIQYIRGNCVNTSEYDLNLCFASFPDHFYLNDTCVVETKC